MPKDEQTYKQYHPVVALVYSIDTESLVPRNGRFIREITHGERKGYLMIEIDTIWLAINPDRVTFQESWNGWD